MTGESNRAPWFAPDADPVAIQEAQRAVARQPTPEQYAREFLGLPPEWRVYEWKSLGVHPHYIGLTVTGSIPRAKRSGRYKGEPTWRDKVMERSLSVSTAQMDAFRAKWEAESGACHACLGTGHELHGWSLATGPRFRPCPRCNATGDAPALAQPKENDRG